MDNLIALAFIAVIAYILIAPLTNSFRPDVVDLRRPNKLVFVIVLAIVVAFASVYLRPATPINAFEVPTPIPFIGGFQ